MSDIKTPCQVGTDYSSGRLVAIRKLEGGKYHAKVNGELLAVAFENKPTQEEALAAVKTLQHFCCIICDEKTPLTTEEAVARAGWNLRENVHICPRDRTSTDIITYNALYSNCLVEFRPVIKDGKQQWSMWANPYYRSSGSYSKKHYFDNAWEELGYFYEDLPDESKALGIVNDMMIISCSYCNKHSRLAYVEDIEDVQGWQLLPEDEDRCPDHEHVSSDEYVRQWDEFNGEGEYATPENAL